MAERLNITLLGGIAITRGDKPVTGLGTRKAEALLVYLVMQQRPFSRELLADLLWDDRPQEQALANLRSLLSGLRRKLGDYLIINRQTVAFDQDSNYWLDVAVFEHLLKVEDARSGDAGYQTSINHLQTAVAHYQGDFLAGFHIREAYRFEEWAVLERERLRRLAVRTLRQLVDDSLGNGRYSQGLQYVDHLIRLDNLSEHAHRQKMLLLTRSGQRNAALRQYDACRRLLDEELGVKPAAATTELFERLRALTFPPPHKLPLPPTPFVGRTAELVALRDYLVNPVDRLVTLFGPGGIGKTRLALESARQLVKNQSGRFFDGVFYVPLAAVTGIQQLPDQIAHTVGFTYQGAEPRETQLVSFLKSKEMLLVLDNFEQFLSTDVAADLIASILREAPQITLLVTSRERLNLYEETLFEIEGLGVPSEQAKHPEQYSAVQLFLQRVQRINRDCAPTATDFAAIVRSCELLGGMPLAIELAAGWARQHSFAEIEAQIKASFDFLQAVYRNVPQRQRSLRAVFDHSWQLLMPHEQMVFKGLAVFPDSFSLDAAQSIVDHLADGSPLMTLADKSLLQRQPNGRFQVHPILHQYAMEKLAEDRELATAVARRHTHYYLGCIEQQNNGESVTERAVIGQELPNIQAVWERVARQQDYVALGRVIPVLNGFYNAQSWFQEGIDTFKFALSQIGSLSNIEALSPIQIQTRCDLWARKARMHIYIGQLQEAEADLAQAMMYVNHVDDPDLRSMVLSYLSMTQFYAGKYAQAIESLEEGLQLALQADSLEGMSFAYNFLGSCYKAQGEYQKSRLNFEYALDAYRQAEDEIGEGIALHNLGNLAQAMREYEAAQAYYQACTAVFKAIDYTQGTASTLSNAGRLALQMENYPEAEKLLAEALLLKEQINDERGMAVALVGLGAVTTVTGELAQARGHLAQALTLAQKTGDVRLMIEAVVITAVYAKNSEQFQTSADLVTYVLRHPAAVEEVRQQAEKLMYELGEDVATAVSNLPTPPERSVDNLVSQLLTQILSVD